MKGINSSLPTKELNHKVNMLKEEQLPLPLFKVVMDEVLSMSDIVMKMEEEVKIRRDSTRRTKILKSELDELAKKVQEYKGKEVRLDS